MFVHFPTQSMIWKMDGISNFEVHLLLLLGIMQSTIAFNWMQKSCMS